MGDGAIEGLAGCHERSVVLPWLPRVGVLPEGQPRE